MAYPIYIYKPDQHCMRRLTCQQQEEGLAEVLVTADGLEVLAGPRAYRIDSADLLAMVKMMKAMR